MPFLKQLGLPDTSFSFTSSQGINSFILPALRSSSLFLIFSIISLSERISLVASHSSFSLRYSIKLRISLALSIVRLSISRLAFSLTFVLFIFSPLSYSIKKFPYPSFYYISVPYISVLGLLRKPTN